MNGGPSQMDLLDYKPKLEKMFDKDLPDSIRKGQRLTTMTSGQTRFPDRAVEVQVRPARQVAARWVSELLPWTAKIVDDIARDQDGPHRGDQPRPGRHLHLHRQPAPRPAEPRLVAQLRPRHDEREPAGVRRHDADLVGRTRCPGPLSTASGARASCRASTRAWRCAPRAIRSSSSRTRPASTPRPAARMLDALAGSTSSKFERRRRPRDPDPHRPVRDGVPHAELGPRADRHLRTSPSTSRHVRPRRPRSPAPSPHSCLLARRLAERGVRFVADLPPRLGPARQPRRATCRCSAATSTRPATA